MILANEENVGLFEENVGLFWENVGLFVNFADCYKQWEKVCYKSILEIEISNWKWNKY